MVPDFVRVHAFVGRGRSGNPAAVILLPEPKSPAWMQSVAAEMGLSETAFLRKTGDGGYDLRWFTPTTEVPLCGHATLASAHALFETGRLSPGATARFHTRSGVLTAKRRGPGLIELDFPSIACRPAPAPASLRRALGARPAKVSRCPGALIVELRSERALRGIRPDLHALSRIPPGCFLVTARSSSRHFDFVSRCFFPAEGIDEDPVTGSAHCALAPYWSPRLGKGSLRACQASARGGELRMSLRGDRVLLLGRAVTVIEGKLHAGPGLGACGRQTC